MEEKEFEAEVEEAKAASDAEIKEAAEKTAAEIDAAANHLLFFLSDNRSCDTLTPFHT